MKLNRKSWPRLVRGLLSLSVLLGICAMLFPLPIAPLPRTSPEKDSAEPFPCQNRPCGCRSAEQCWKKCCCFNNTQKIAWAKAHKVKVPDFVLAAEKKERLSSLEICSLPQSDAKATVVGKSTAGCSHCKRMSAVVVKSSCCDKAKTPTVAKSRSPDCCSPLAERSPEARRKPASSKWVMAVYAAECQGQGPPAFCFPVSIMPDRPLLVTPSVEVIETFVFESERLQQASLRPPLPPPKIA